MSIKSKEQPKQPFTPADKARIMHNAAEKNGGVIPKDHFAPRVQKLVDKQKHKK